MCGITGWVDYKRSLEGERDIVTKMAETLAKRGPDDNKVWIKGNVAFGHKRLIVVDPEGGKQPMTCLKNETSYAICYNGELYNTEDIRKELLRRGYTFKGHSDTEVLLASYIEWKEECVDHLNGIYAFAVWDEKNERVFIARDRLGVKPLFYKYDSGRLLFGSELKAILVHPDVKAEVTLEGLSEIFGLGPSRTPGHGVYAGIQELRPGHAMTFSKDGLCIWRYWNVESKKHEDSFEETVEKTRFLLQDAITRQLVSDVPLCTFLSGGVDSSAITAIAAKEYERSGKGQLHTYSVDYEDNDKYFKANAFQPNSDAPFINLMTETFQTIHHRCVISNEQLAQYLTEAVLVRDLPGMADIDSSLLWFCREIKQDFVVGLSGECADEIFGGYPWFYREDDLQSSAFPWMRSTEAREQLLKKEWRNKLNLQQYVQQRYEESIQEVPILEGESPLEAKRRQLFYSARGRERRRPASPVSPCPGHLGQPPVPRLPRVSPDATPDTGCQPAKLPCRAPPARVMICAFSGQVPSPARTPGCLPHARLAPVAAPPARPVALTLPRSCPRSASPLRAPPPVSRQPASAGCP